MRFVLNRVKVCVVIVVATTATACGGSNRPPVDAPASDLSLNDTGVSHCGSDADVFTVDPLAGCGLESYPLQDAEVGRDYRAASGALAKQGGGAGGFDFVKLGAAGQVFAEQTVGWDAAGTEALGSQWACVQDAHTGLTWEVKHSLPSHSRYGGNTYSWWSDDASNGGEQGSLDGGDCSDGRCDSAGYAELLNTMALCGYDDWRLPTTTEFLTIGHLGRGDPAIDTTYFPNTLGLRHWTAETYQKTPLLAWYMYFSDGSVSFTGKGDPSYLRLVRGEL